MKSTSGLKSSATKPRNVVVDSLRRRPDLFAVFVGALVAGALLAQFGMIAWLVKP